MSESDVTVVVCSHDIRRWPRLQQAVASLRAQTQPPAQIVVVIDGDPQLAVHARAGLGESCRVVVKPRSDGLSAARNTGISAARTRFIGFLDDDAVADVTWLERLRGHLTDDSVLVAGGCVRPDWESPSPRWFSDELLWIVGCAHVGLPTETADVRNIAGGCAIYRADAFDRCGGFRPDLGRNAKGAEGCEETELCIRMRREIPTARIVYEPSAVIRHHVPTARLRMRYVMRRSFDEGRSKAVVASLQRDREWLAVERAFVSAALGRRRATDRATLDDDGRSMSRYVVMLASISAAATGYASQSLIGRRPAPTAPRV